MKVTVVVCTLLLILSTCLADQVATRLSRKGLQPGTTVLYASRVPATTLAPAAAPAVDPSKLVLTPGKLITPAPAEGDGRQFIAVRTDGPSTAPSAISMNQHQQPEYNERYQQPEHTTSFGSSSPVIDCVGGQPCGGKMPAKIEEGKFGDEKPSKKPQPEQQQEEQEQQQQQQQQQQEEDQSVEEKLDDLLEALEGIKSTLEEQRGESTEIAEQAAEKIKTDLKDKEKTIAEEGAKEAEEEEGEN